MEWLVTCFSESPTQHAAAILVAIAILAFIWLKLIQSLADAKRHPRPPGPTPFPLLGHVLSINTQEPWLTFTAWRTKYGDVVYARLVDTDVVVLNSYSDAIELLEKRSQIYSDRPFMATVEPYGHDANTSFMQYGSRWRLGRRIIHQTFHAEAARAFRPKQLRGARQVIINIMDDPNEYSAYYSTFGSALALSAVYDYGPKAKGDPLVKLIHDFCDASLPALTPGMSAILKHVPFVLSIPEWIPGLSRIRQQANKARALGTKVLDTPYKLVLNRMESFTYFEARENIDVNTMVFDHIRRMERLDSTHRAEYENALKAASLTSFLGAAETTTAVLLTFTLAMVKHPRVWIRAQAEIDMVIGADRLPEFEDRPSLPYVEAILRESLRWVPVVPMGVPHAVISDDVYKGHYIPRGATVLANIWAMSRDENRYPDPETFDPERFLTSEGALNDDNPADYVFGFGRRRCPGRHVGDASVWSAIVTLLATVDFHAVKDEDGNDLDFDVQFANGITHHPMSFPCNLVPRAHVTRDALQRLLVE